jgi:hypothetical protein
VNDTCQNGVCQPGATCPGPGPNTMCCSTGMFAGQCKRPAGASCTAPANCCSNICLPPVLGVRRCA